MDRMIKAVINGKETPLNYSIEVMFNVTDKFGDIQTALDTIAKDSKEGFEAVIWFAVQMANDAELCRRAEGYEPQPMIKASEIPKRMRPWEFNELRDAVCDAIALGYKREIPPDENEEIDLTLMELEAKKADAGE